MPTAVYNADFSQFDRETAKAAAAVKQFTREAEKSAKDLGQISGALDGVAQQATAVGTSFLKLTGAVAVGSLLADAVKALGTAVIDTAKDTIKYADSLADLSAKTGMTTTGLQKLGFATEQSGVSLESVTRASTKLGAALVAGDKSVVGGLTKLGLSVAELRQLQPDQLFVKVADAVGKITDPMERARRAQEIFGKQGLELLPALTGEMAKTVAEAEKLGIIISPEVIANAAKLADQFDILALQGRAFVAEALAPMVPLLSEIVQGISDVAGGVIEKLKTAFVDPGVVQAAQTLKESIADIFGTTQEERVNTIAKALVGLASVGVQSAEILIRSFAGVTAGVLALAVAIGRAREAQLLFALKFEEAGGVRKATDDLFKLGEQALKVSMGEAPIFKDLDRLIEKLDTARGKIGAFTAEAIRPLPSHGPAEKPGKGRGVGVTDADAAAISKAAAALKQFNAERDKLSGKAAVDAATRLVAVITAAGGAAKILQSEAAGAATTLVAGINAMVQRGEEVPPIWQAIAVQLQIVSGKTEGLYPPLEKARQVTQALAESFGAMSHVDWSKIAPPPFKFPEVEIFKGGIPPGAQSHPDWSKIPPPPKGFSLFGDPAQLGAQLTSNISGAILNAQKGMKGEAVGGAIGSTLGGSIGKSLSTTLTTAFPKVMGTALGKMAGAAIPILGEIGGQLAGALLGKLFGPSQKEKAEAARKDWIKSAGGLDAIKEAAARANVSTDALMKATTEKGLTKEIEKFNAALVEADKRIKTTIDALGKLTSEGGLISKDLVASLKKDSDQKDVQAALKQFQGAQTEKAVGGLGTFLTQATVTSKAGVDALAGSLTALFGSLQQQGLSATQAIAALQVPMAALQAQLTKTGMQAPAAFGELARLAQIAGDAIAGPMIAGVSGLGQAMEGLHNTGLLTQEMFVGLATEVGATFKKLQDQGTGGKNAIALMQKPLQTIWELQQKFGFEVDETTQGVIDLALEGGQIGESFLPAADKIALSIDKLITKLDAMFTGMVTGAQTGADKTKIAIERTLGGIRIPTIEVPVIARYEGFEDVGNPSVSVNPASASSIEARGMTVTTELDGAVIARNQIPHIARELTLVGV